MPDYGQDPRTVMTLDAGGTNLKFTAIRGNQVLFDPVFIPTEAAHLDRCLASIVRGFHDVKARLSEPPVAISFAFPGPADYPRGIIGDLPNLSAFRGGVALGPMLEDEFKLPVFINNDGDLFAYGEAIAGFLPHVNRELEKAGSPKRYKNLLGVTLGTGFGAGLVRNGELFIGDNNCAGDIWQLRNKLQPDRSVEEGASIRAVRRVYAAQAVLPFDEAPDPRVIFDIALGNQPGNPEAAREAFRQMGEVVGDALAQALALIDGLAVIGGGLSHRWPLFLQGAVDEMNSTYRNPKGGTFRRLSQTAFNLEDPAQLALFLKGGNKEINVPGSTRKISFDPLPRIGVGVTRLGTSEAVAVGAYAFALEKLGKADTQPESL